MKTKRNIKILYIFFALLLLVSAVFGGGYCFPAFADTAQYTSALEDLQRDENFDINDYPDKANDYSIKVIQIAESANGELFIYTYQPSQKTKPLEAFGVNMSLSQDVNETDYYELELLNYDGVICKYKVKYVFVSSEKVRYYNITSIYRDYLLTDGWDTDSDGQVITERALPVGQLWTAVTVNGNVLYDVADVEVVRITSQMTGFRRFDEGFKFQGTYSCDSHFLAFSCDHAIDRLISADVSFCTRDYKAMAGGEFTYLNDNQHKVTLYDYEKVETDSTGWFNGGDYIWDRMSSTKDYVASLREQGSSITDDEVKELLKYDWILSFYETEYKCEAGGKDVLITALIPFGFVWTIVNSCTTTGTIVADVTLLRLEFEYQGEVYNMGVVSNRQTGPKEPFGSEQSSVTKFFNSIGDFFGSVGDFFKNIWQGIRDFFSGKSAWWVYVIIAVIVLIPVLGILAAFIPSVAQFLLKVLKGIGIALWWVISLPFRAIAALVRKVKDNKDS